MSNQTPPQPPPKFWDALPQIVGKLKNEFLLVTLGILVLVIAIGVFAPDVIDRLGRAFFYLLVVLAWLAYLVGRVLNVWRKGKPVQPPAGSEPAGGSEPSTPTPSAQADRGSAAASDGSIANVGQGNVNVTGDVGGNLTITQGDDRRQIGGPIQAERIEVQNVVSGVQIVYPPETGKH